MGGCQLRFGKRIKLHVYLVTFVHSNPFNYSIWLRMVRFIRIAAMLNWIATPVLAVQGNPAARTGFLFIPLLVDNDSPPKQVHFDKFNQHTRTPIKTWQSYAT